MATQPEATPKSLKSSKDGQNGKLEAKLHERKTVVIGRGPECDVVIKDPKASRRHCQLSRVEAAFILEDLGSKNGTLVDGLRIEGKVSLKPNQAFKIGDTVFYIA